MTVFLDEIQSSMPPQAQVEKVQLEGSKIVIYAKKPEFFSAKPEIIKTIVDRYKKRVDIRADVSVLLDPEKAKKQILEMVPKEAEVTEIIFMSDVSRVVIEAKKPGLVIGKAGATLRDIKNEIKWSPRVERTPIIPSQIIQTIRHVLYMGGEDRAKFLASIGRKVRPKSADEIGEDKWVRVSALGGFREVGRSAVFVQTQDSKILLDCGVNVAATGPGAYPYLNAPEFDLKTLDAIVVSHAHLDHSGFIPYLYKYGYDGPVYCTPPTRDLMTLLQIDYVDIAQREGKKVPFSKKDIQDVIKHTITLDYEEVTDITQDCRLTLYPAGHMLGSSMIHLHIGEGLHNIIYTGDIKFESTNLLEGAASRFPRLETLIMESTYGGKNDIQPSRLDGERDLYRVIEDTFARKGKVLLPVLAVGRAQEVMIILEKYARQNKLEDSLKVYLDGMIWDATAIHTAYPEYLSRKLRQQIFHEDQNPFMAKIFHRIGSALERKELIESGESVVILATSGMLAGGPSVEYFRNLAESKKNSIVFASYQAEGSLGRRVQKGMEKITLENDKGQNEMVDVKMSVHTIEGFSGHSDRHSLMSFVGKLNPKPDRVLICHGENSKCLDLASSLHKMYNIDTYAPKPLETVRLR